ncbi:MAG: hypothetical protein J5595_09295 [Bacteroidales bacterium]|nr:hypothetical protein [Bacteroidales bacterium]
MRTSDEIDYNEGKVSDEETLIRLLCSPLFYNEQTHQVNLDAFDLRMLGKRPETYVSLGRKKFLDTEAQFNTFLQKGFQIWNPKKKDKYYGYGEFMCAEALSISPKIEINPLKGNDQSHIGMFYAKDENQYYSGPLPKHDPEILEMLSDLAAMLSDKVVKFKYQD